jgi:hypothetical protein
MPADSTRRAQAPESGPAALKGRGDETGRRQPPHGRELGGIDHHCLLRVIRGDEGDEAVITVVPLGAGTSPTIDRELHVIDHTFDL